MTWKNGRRLATFTKGDVSASFDYDADGLRTTKTVGTSRVDYYRAGGLLLGEVHTDGDESYTINYMYDESGRMLGFRLDGAEYYYVRDYSGDVTGLINSRGELIGSYLYDPWGVLLETYLNTFEEETAEWTDADRAEYMRVLNLNPIRYKSYYYDTETGFYYLQSRYYDPITTRFTNADNQISTSSDLSELNLFAYCGNNPISRVDSSGQFWLSALIVTVVASVAIAKVGYSHVTNRNSRRNSKVDSNSKTTTKNKIINDQNLATGKNFEYGLHSASSNACEAIAVHNAKVSKKIDSSLSQTMTDFQSTGAMVGYGLLGSNPYKIGDVLGYEGIEYSRVGLDDMTEEGTYIISYWNQNAPWHGLHTVALTYNGTKYIAYNLKGDGRAYRIYLSDYTESFICGYYLK